MQEGETQHEVEHANRTAKYPRQRKILAVEVNVSRVTRRTPCCPVGGYRSDAKLLYDVDLFRNPFWLKNSPSFYRAICTLMYVQGMYMKSRQN